MSGEVDDDTAQALGRMAGAQIIISGAVSRIGDLYRLRVRALSVQSARIEGQFNRNISDGPTVSALVRSQAMGYGGSGQSTPPAKTTPPAQPPAQTAQPAQTPTQTAQPATQPAQTAQSAQTAQPPAQPAKTAQPAQTAQTPAQPPAQTAQPAQPPAQPAPQPVQPPASKQEQPGLYAGDTFQGDMDFYDILDWIALNAQSGGNYRIVLGKDQAITPTELNYDKKTVTITLKSAGNSKRTIKFEGSNPAYSLFTINPGVTFVLEEGVTLSGAQNSADKSLVRVAGGRFIMNGGVITGNKTSGSGGGVRVDSGSFTMNNGTISGNTSSNSGGGVYVASGTFTMTGGTISGNTAILHGGGVYVASGTFTMTGGAISGNTASGSTYNYGGGVFVDSGTFTMTGGTISGNTANNSDGGGGVYVKGTFTMDNGNISGNTTRGSGGGVWAGTFIMNNGTISGNTASSGGGVYAGTFTKSGTAGIIYGSNASEEQANKATDDSKGHAVYANSKKRNTTARVTTAMDSKKDGPAGGWE